MEELLRKKDYVGKKYLLNNYKLNINSIISPNGFLKGFELGRALKDVLSKEYYDTEDKFFKKSGITISINRYSDRANADLIIRYESEVARIAFLSNMPNTFINKIGKKQQVHEFYSYITTSISELVPKGLDIDIYDYVKKIKRILTVSKNRTRYRVINNSGLKVIFSFEQCIYQNSKGQKYKPDLLELRLDSGFGTTELFNQLVRGLELQEYKLIKINPSDIFIGAEYLEL